MPSLATRLGLDSGVHRLLETPLSINGAEGSTILRFLGSQASASGWPEYGGAGTLALAGAGAAMTYDLAAPYLGSLDEAVLPTSAGKRYDGSGAGAMPDVFTTRDAVLEFVSDVPSVFFKRLLSTSNDGSTARTGVELWATSAPTWDFVPTIGTSYVEVQSGAIAGIHHALCVLDRSGSGQWYINGAASGSAANISSLSASWQAAQTPSLLGSATSGGTPSRVFYLAIHVRASGWLDTHLQATIAAQRFALLTASRPSFSVVPSTFPTAKGSTSPVYQQRRLASGSDQLFYMGASAPTFDRIVDAAGRAVVGHLVEAAATNRQRYSRAPQSWLVEGSPTRTAGQASPSGDTGACLLEGITQSGGATVYLVSVGTGAAQSLECSLWIKRVSTSGVLAVVNAHGGVGDGHWTIDFAGLPDQWVRLDDLSSYVTVVVAFKTSSASNCGTWLYRSSGSDPLSFYVDHVQQEELVDYRSSEIVVPATSVITRAASSLKYSTANCLPRSEGSIVGAILCRSFTPSRARVLFSLDDGTANNRVELFTTATTGLLSALSRKASGTSGDVELTAHGSVYDNKIRPFMLTWNAAELALWVRDPTTRAWSVARDTSITPVAGATFTTLCVGHDNATANHAGPGAYPLAGWALLPDHYDDPSQVRRADSTLWEAY